MATVTGFTAARMQAIEDGTVVDGIVNGSGHLILEKHDGSTIDAGLVVGPTGPAGPEAVQGIPGEIKMWSGATLPDSGDYGVWTWANGDVFAVLDYPLAAAHIDPVWKTAHGLSDPGAGNFRVPDLRGLVPAALDQMPAGGRANRTTRAVAIVLAGRTGEETHVITLPELPVHNHGYDQHYHAIAPHTHPLQHGYAGVQAGSSFDALKKTTASPLQNFTTDGSAVQNSGGVVPVAAGGYAGADDDHENMQPTVFVPYIVKLDD